MSEPVADQSGRAAARYRATYGDLSGPAIGRHAFDEDAALTPIFHALTRGGWRSRPHEQAAPPPSAEADPVELFRRDPLTAPIPCHVLAPAFTPGSFTAGSFAPGRSSSLARWADPIPQARPETSDNGRHHHRREPVGSGAR